MAEVFCDRVFWDSGLYHLNENLLALFHNITYHNNRNVINHNITIKEKIMAREATITFEQVAAGR